MRIPLALVLVLAGVAHAGTLAEVRARGKLVVSVKNEGAASPSMHHDPAHFQKRGFELELAHALAKKILGDPQKLELELMPRAGRLFAVAEDRVDLVLSMIAVTDERKRQVDFSRPYYATGLVLLVRPDSKLTRLDELDGKRVLALRQTGNDPSSELARRAAGRGAHFTVERVQTFAEAEQAISAGRADGLVTEAPNADAWLAHHPQLRRTPILVSQQIAVAVKKGNRELLEQVNAALDELDRSGELRRLQLKAGLIASP